MIFRHFQVSVSRFFSPFKVEGSLKDKRVVDVFGGCNGSMANELDASGSFDVFFVDQHSVVHELNFGLGVGSPAGGSSPAGTSPSLLLTGRRRPPIPEPIECTPFCFDLVGERESTATRYVAIAAGVFLARFACDLLVRPCSRCSSGKHLAGAVEWNRVAFSASSAKCCVRDDACGLPLLVSPARCLVEGDHAERVVNA